MRRPTLVLNNINKQNNKQHSSKIFKCRNVYTNNIHGLKNLNKKKCFNFFFSKVRSTKHHKIYVFWKDKNYILKLYSSSQYITPSLRKNCVINIKYSFHYDERESAAQIIKILIIIKQKKKKTIGELIISLIN